MGEKDLSRAHLEAVLSRELHRVADAHDLERAAIDDLAAKAAREGGYGLTSDGRLDARRGLPLSDWISRAVEAAPFYKRSSKDRPHDPRPPRVGRLDAKGRRRSAADLLELANGEGAR